MSQSAGTSIQVHVNLVQGRQDKSENEQEAFIKRVDEVNELFSKYCTEKNWDALKTLFCQDAVEMPPFHDFITGNSDIVKYIEEARKAFGSAMYTQKVVYYGPADGNISFVRGTYDIRLDGVKIPFTEGKYLMVYKKVKENGKDQWYIYSDCFNSSATVPKFHHCTIL
ncbi:uncharacterized protein [Dysidea avara]|uniref:uncharacterized protein isoform X1 n=1 Tax=Dysidea avara TaxID=196820 RepID=UPI003334507D